MSAEQARPAWSSVFEEGSVAQLERIEYLDDVTPDWAWGGSTGAGVKVAVIDSGVDASHPAVGRVEGYLSVEGPTGGVVSDEPHDDAFGHHSVRRDHSLARAGV